MKGGGGIPLHLFENLSETIGKTRMNIYIYMTDRLIAKASSICDTFKKNNLPLFPHKNATVTSKSKQKIVSLNSDRCLYSDLYVAC